MAFNSKKTRIFHNLKNICSFIAHLNFILKCLSPCIKTLLIRISVNGQGEVIIE